jgi:hypothetical protein
MPCSQCTLGADGVPFFAGVAAVGNERRMMSDELYGVVFDEGGDTYLVALFDVRNEAETEKERLEDDRYVREVEGGEVSESDYEPIYEVEEFDREVLDDSVFDQLQRGLTVRMS